MEPLATDLHWAALHVGTLCHHDTDGRLVRWNEPDRLDSPAPLFWFGATLHGNLWRFRVDLPKALVRELARLAAAERTVTALGGDPERLRSFEEHLARHDFAFEIVRGLAFRFPLQLPSTQGAARLSADRVADLVRAFPEWTEFGPERFPCWVQERAGEIVSACYAATASAGATAVELGVETVASVRGQGLAQAPVVAWAKGLQLQGRTPLFSALQENRSSRALAAKLRLVPYASTLYFRQQAVG